MVFDQHSAAFRQSACAVRLEIGAELGAEFVRALPRAESPTHALRRRSSSRTFLVTSLRRFVPLACARRRAAGAQAREVGCGN